MSLKQNRFRTENLVGGRSRLPIVTVVTPSFNQGKFIERTIRSVLEQGISNIEYIIIDGGSSDGSVEIIERYSTQLAYWVSEKDRGQADAIAKGFRRATGDILCWLNSDDILLPGALSAVCEYFQKHPAVEAVSGGAVQITESGGVFSCWCNYTLGVRASYTRFSLIGQQGVFQPSTFWRHDAYLAVGGINTQLQFIMDLDLFVRLARRRRFERIPALLAAFRIHAGAKTSRLQSVQSQELAVFHDKYPPGFRFPLAASIARCCYWLLVQLEKVIIVAAKAWSLRDRDRLLRQREPDCTDGQL